MELSVFTIKIVVLLLPGIFSTFIIENLTNRKKFDIRTFIVSVIMLGFISYFILLVCHVLKDVILVGIKNYSFKNISFFESLVSTKKSIRMDEVLYATIISIITGIIIAKNLNNGLIFKIFRKLNITLKTGNDVWNDVFDNNGKSIDKYVYIVDKKYNYVYGGWLEHYSYDPDNKELHLINVLVTRDSNRNRVLRRYDELYITYNNDYMYIEINNENNQVDKSYNKSHISSKDGDKNGRKKRKSK